MKRWSGGAAVIFLFALLIFRYAVVESPLAERSLQNILHRNASGSPLYWLSSAAPPAAGNPENFSAVVSTDTLASWFSSPGNLSADEELSLQTWRRSNRLIGYADRLPHGVEAVKEASVAWARLVASIRGGAENDTAGAKKQCPYSIHTMNVSAFDDDGRLVLKIPCGLIQGSSLTVIGTPGSYNSLGNFKIELTGTTFPGEPDPPIMLHYNVRLLGDKVSDDPVIVQNTWTATGDWGSEERCPSDDDTDHEDKVDGSEKCGAMVGKDEKHIYQYNDSRALPPAGKKEKKKTAEPMRRFPFKQGYLAIAILRVGTEGIHMMVDGKHATSFAFREGMEPWFVSKVRIWGDISLMSVIASGLPTSEDLEHAVDLQLLKVPPLPAGKAVDLFIGIVSTANNFKRRMAVRRTWMQYDSVRSGAVVVRFFVGLHKNEAVNEELWKEARTYGDLQLMPFVDYYTLITWKTAAICIFGTKAVPAKYIMKTDDDAFVRVDEVLRSLQRANVSRWLLYGRINSNSEPHRDPGSKWHITHEEWPAETYPPWAHGPGYVVSRDIAAHVYKQHEKGHLKMFKLEDVAMGVWIDEMKSRGSNVTYLHDERIYTEGCSQNYVVAHYQEPREMLCLWEKLQLTKQAECCDK